MSALGWGIFLLLMALILARPKQMFKLSASLFALMLLIPVLGIAVFVLFSILQSMTSGN